MPRSQQVLVPETADVAYAAVMNVPGSPKARDGRNTSIVVCIRHQQGYRLVSEYGPYAEERAKEVANALNARLGHTEREAAIIVASTMRNTR